MKRTAIGFLVVVVLVFSTTSDAQRRRRGGRRAAASPAGSGKVNVPCPGTLNDITDCPDTGCGNLDPELNKQKNTTVGDPDSAKDTTFADFAQIPESVSGYNNIGDPRQPLRDAGEGNMVRVVAWALDARPQKTTGKDKNGNPKKGETCNCGFTGVNDPENTDVHIVLVDDATLDLTAPAGNRKTAAFNTLKLREAESQTAEFTPRVRIARNEQFDGANLKNLIDPVNGGTLRVRVSGLLMYDSEHALGPFKLLRQHDLHGGQ